MSNSNDFDDLEALPLNSRKNDSIVPRLNGKLAYLSKDKKHLWDIVPTTQARTRARNIIRMCVGRVTDVAKVATTAIEAWKLFFPDDMLLEITNCTNQWIDKNKDNYRRERDCKSTTLDEIKAVIGILYMAGVLKASHDNLDDLWNTKGLGVEFVLLVMPKKRFRFLLQALRFDDSDTRHERKIINKLAPIRSIFEEFVKDYVVSEFVTVDEMLDAFRGRCSF